MDNKIVTFESKFGKPEKFNSQFHMVKIYIAYAGKNRNGSIISKETFEKLIPSLYGVPVVGEWKETNQDFGSHGGKIEISEDGIQYIDTTKPYGFVDSSATVQWENVVEEDETEREYLTTTAFLWTSRYPEVLKVLENKNNQSMELNIFDGKMSEEYPEYFEILDGEFSALCILGEDIEGCFESAKVSQFNLDKDAFKSEFTQMVAELKKSLNFTNEGGDNLEDKKFEEELVETTEQEFEKDETVEEAVVETSEEETTEEFVEDVVNETTENTDETTANTSEEEVEEKFTKVFELSHDDIRTKLYGLLYEVEDEDDDWYYINEVFDTYFIYSGYKKIYKQSYVKTDVDVAFEGERVEMFIEYLTAEELEELNKMRDNYSLILKENEELKEFKAQKDKEEFEAEQEKLREEKIEHINTEYEHISDDIKELFISKVDEYESTEDLDADICVYIVKNKVTFSKAKKENTSIKLEVEQNEQKLVMSPYGDLF